MEERTVKILIYVLLSLAIGIGGTVALMSGGRSTAGIIYLIGAILIFRFFGLRWFVYSTPSWVAKSWPPNINTCPDFLVYMSVTDGNNKYDTCIDVQGVSTQPTVLKCWPKDGTTPTFSPVNYGYFFNKTEILKNVNASDVNAVRSALSTAAIQAGVSWEGLTDGKEPVAFNTAATTSTCASQPGAPPANTGNTATPPATPPPATPPANP